MRRVTARAVVIATSAGAGLLLLAGADIGSKRDWILFSLGAGLLVVAATELVQSLANKITGGGERPPKRVGRGGIRSRWRSEWLRRFAIAGAASSVVFAVVAPVREGIPALKVRHFGRAVGSVGWWEAPAVAAGENVEFRVDLENTAIRPLANVRVAVELPRRGARYLPGTIVVRTSQYPNGRGVPDGSLEAPRLELDELAVGDTAVIRFRVKTDPYSQTGPYDLAMKVSVRALEVPRTKSVIATRVIDDDAMWGPQRPLVVADPAGSDRSWGTRHVTFNSWLNYAPYHFDHTRFFYARRPAGYSVLPEDSYEDVITARRIDDYQVEVGDTVRLETFVHNSVDPTRARHHTARDATVRLDLPEWSDDELVATSYLSAANSRPYEVFDTVRLWSREGFFALRYVERSAWIYTELGGWRRLRDEIVDDGVLVGERRSNGIMPGTSPGDWARVIVDVEVAEPSFDWPDPAPRDLYFDMSVSPIPGDWGSGLEVEPGDVVAWKIHAVNYSKRLLNDMDFDAVLPDGLRVDGDSVTMFNEHHPKGFALSDWGLFENGVSVGDYAADQGVAIRFRTVVADEFDHCGRLPISFPATATGPDIEPETDWATVVVDNDC